MPVEALPQFAAGAVYFRKSNPPPDEWERDYQTASRDGLNVFRHWFLWGAIETAPGQFDWADYDRQLELGAKYGLGAVIAEHLTAPEWLYALVPDAFHVGANGQIIRSNMSASSATGFGAACLDNSAVRDRAAGFLTELARRYKGHPGLMGYDVQNEFHYFRDCFCRATMEKFRLWLREKYKELSAVNRAWRRYSYTDWTQIQPPRQLGPYPECLDWIIFRKEGMYESVQWKIDLIKAADPDALITGHGEASSLNNFTLCGSDEWRAAEKVAVYGMTYVQERHGTEAWKQLHCADLVRAGSRGKPWWHAEFQGGPVWINPFAHTQLRNRKKYDGRMVSAEDIRIWSFLSIAGGARGILSPRWRPLLDGHLFGAYGFYGSDGLPTERSDMLSAIARWANDPAQEDFFQSKPQKGELGLLVLPESLAFKTLLGQDIDSGVFDKAISGAYKAFYDNNIPVDFVDIADINQYQFLFLAYPVMGYRKHFDLLTAWVKAGGKLICQGCPAYFGEDGHVGVRQPNFDLDAFFGCTETGVEFLPDISRDIHFNYRGMPVDGRMYQQRYAVTDAAALGDYQDGGVAAAEKTHGAGKSLLIGTFPSAAYYEDSSDANRAFFAELYRWGGYTRQIIVSNPAVHARLFQGKSLYVMLINPGDRQTGCSVALTRYPSVRCVRVLWGDAPRCEGNRIDALVGAKDVLIFEIAVC
jgi:beta-galactosidase